MSSTYYNPRKEIERTEAISVNCMPKFELLLDESPVNIFGNSELFSGIGFTWNPDPEPLFVPVLIIGNDEPLEDSGLHEKNEKNR